MTQYATQQLLTRWEDRRTCQNIAGKVSQSYLIKEEYLIYDRFWSTREDVCLGVNQGWYYGKAAVQGYYKALEEQTRLWSRLMKDYFQKYLGDKTEEECFGVGQLGYKPLDTCVLEVAGDGQTAKGLWCIRGGYVRITGSGMVSNTEYGYLAIDFIKEDGQWKIWHMQNLDDIDHPSGTSWADPAPEFEAVPEFAEAEAFQFPEPNVKTVLRETYHNLRPFTPSPEPPVPYDTFAHTFSYGMQKED